MQIHNLCLEKGKEILRVKQTNLRYPSHTLGRRRRVLEAMMASGLPFLCVLEGSLKILAYFHQLQDL